MNKPDLRAFPDEPGVYLYKDAAGRILYVGKARRLRRRLASYFRKASSLPQKTRLMLEQAERIDILRTGTEKEALLLEASLIKKHRPRFNIVLRDDKHYLLFRIGHKHPYPRVEIVRPDKRRGREAGARYFGPYSSGLAARETWRLIHRYFPLRRCRDAAFANRSRPCLYYDMGQCLAPCVLPVAQEDYKALLDKVVMLLSGRPRELVGRLKAEMAEASAQLRFEQAAALRDQIRAVERTLERQSVVLAESTNLDAIGVAQTPAGLALGILFVRGGLLLDGRNFFWPGLSVEDTPELLSGFLAQYYLERRGLGESIPPRIIAPWLPEAHPARAAAEQAPVGAAVDASDQESGQEPGQSPGQSPGRCAGLPDQALATDDTVQEAPDGEEDSLSALEDVLAEIRGSAVHISRPRGRDEDQLVVMAATNAAEAAGNAARPRLAEVLSRRLRSARPISRIEVVDISHTGGRQTRAGLVVFEDEQPVKEASRVYKLDDDLAAAGAEAGDDYAALAAWARRRAARAVERPWPDLVLVDGGKGQLEAVRRAMAEAGAKPGLGPDDDFVLASIAKARDDEGRADRRAGNVSDRIFLPGRSNPVQLAPGSPELLFLQRVRDAAHDFVIGRHRRARAKASLAGELTRVPGVGPKLARLLYERFGSLSAMAEAGEEALAAVPGIGRARAAAIAARLATLVKSGA